jgi:TatA/E family protein of Tat protein translocase
VFSLGGAELLIVVLVALLLFGPDKIPQMARTIGRFTREFNKYKDIMESTVRMEIARAEDSTDDEMTIEERIDKAGSASSAIIEAQQASSADATAVATEAEPGALHAAPAPSSDEGDEEDEV